MRRIRPLELSQSVLGEYRVQSFALPGIRYFVSDDPDELRLE
jgi:hypothetical protein